MTATVRPYDHERDFDRIGRFLIDTYEAGPILLNWLQPRWEYMFSHPNIDAIDLEAIGVAEDCGEVVGLVHPEHPMGLAYFQIEPGRDDIKPSLLSWAEEHLGRWSNRRERRVLRLWIDEHDEVLAGLAQERGFELDPRFSESHSRRSLTGEPPESPLPDGYRLQSLAEDNDYRKINRVLWRGFNHPGPPPDEEIAGRIRAQQTPGFRRDLTIVALAPSGDYASFAGIWVVPENGVAYVEPVATDPDHRRLGLARAAVLETLRRARREGATTAWVGSDQELYLSIGFEVTCRTHLYARPTG